MRDETAAFVIFNEAYGYFRQDWLSKMLVRFALRARLYLSLFELYVRRDRRIAKGPVGIYAQRASLPAELRKLEVMERQQRSYDAPADLFQ